jgi:hypothetical protein
MLCVTDDNRVKRDRAYFATGTTPAGSDCGWPESSIET